MHDERICAVWALLVAVALFVTACVAPPPSQPGADATASPTLEPCTTMEVPPHSTPQFLPGNERQPTFSPAQQATADARRATILAWQARPCATWTTAPYILTWTPLPTEAHRETFPTAVTVSPAEMATWQHQAATADALYLATLTAQAVTQQP